LLLTRELDARFARPLFGSAASEPNRYADNTKFDMSTPVQVETFYKRILNASDLEAASKTRSLVGGSIVSV